MAVADAERPGFMIHMTVGQIVGVLVTGFVAGIVAWFCGWVFDAAVFHPLLCPDASASQCGTAPTYSEVAALVVATGVAVFGLVRLQVFRPLLVGLAVALSLWGVLAHLMNGPWLLGVSVYAGLCAVAYLFYTWVARIRSLLTAVITAVLVLVLIRYLLVS